MTVLIFILVLSFLVIVHEVGHLLVAKKSGIKVKEFGLGYPPRLLKLFTRGGTIFSLNWLPMGGFVQLEGEDGPEEEEPAVKTIKTKNGLPFYLAPLSAQLLTLMAGVAFNLLFAILAFTVIFARTGIPRPLTDQVRIAEVAVGSPAEAAALLPDSKILAVEIAGQWQEISSIGQIQELVNDHRGQQIGIRTTTACPDFACTAVEIVEKEIYLRSVEETPADQGAMGVIFDEYYYQHYPWYVMPFYAAMFGVRQALELAVLILQALGGLLVDLMQGKSVANQVAGPVGIVHQASIYGFFSGGFWSILNFAALLSVNLAIMNLLPIPALDGGRAVLLLIERLFPKAKVKEFTSYANYVGFILLIALMVLISFNDIWQIFRT